MELILAPVLDRLRQMTVRDAIDILAVGFLFYQFTAVVRGRRAAQILSGLITLVVVYLVALYAEFDLLRSILQTLAPYTAFALIVMFQSDIRRLLARIGRRRLFSLGSRMQRSEVVEEMLLAVEQMAEKQWGALIVVERDVGLRTFVESGVALDAQFSRDLLLAIFHPNAALHDGAVIVQGERVAAASCFLPLTTNPSFGGRFGTRHRAGIGVTEETDCLSVIVSEETGQISIASHGEIEQHVTLERLEDRLWVHLNRGPVGARRSRAERAAEAAERNA
ncbi:MAG: diadenylate cyclase CdaA [Bryobacteraceae bacterium]|nr:diadenylate cyclase CdaA [Bryobacteraceae bacterium]